MELPIQSIREFIQHREQERKDLEQWQRFWLVTANTINLEFIRAKYARILAVAENSKTTPEQLAEYIRTSESHGYGDGFVGEDILNFVINGKPLFSRLIEMPTYVNQRRKTEAEEYSKQVAEEAR